MLSEAHGVLLELLEEQLGVIPSGLAERVRQIHNVDALRMLKRRLKTCDTLDDFDHLLKKALP